ncbi:MAG: hypothetical protein ACERKD_02065 [Prolixibacteraceae bacterium]
MNKNSILFLFLIPLIFLGLVACQSNGRETNKITTVEKTDSCSLDASHSYEVFIPALKKSPRNLPLLVVIDPHGNGKLAIQQFKEAASAYPAVVVASNLIQNNDAYYISELQELIADAREKYPVGKVTYLSGFSGGARMALSYATAHAVDGVLACGAFAEQEQLAALQGKVMAISGMDDFNFIEAAQFVLNPEKMPSNVFVELTHASHAWPSKELLTNAFGFFQLSETARIGHAKLKEAIKQYTKKQLARIDSFKLQGDVLQAYLVARNMAMISEFEKAGDFTSVANDLRKSKAYAQQNTHILSSIQLEMKVRNAFLKAFGEKDAGWWKKEITSLNDKITSESDAIKRAAYQRIKGFLGIVCYSNCNRYAVQNNLVKLEETLVVYRLIEPENKDMMNFARVLDQLKAQP